MYFILNWNRLLHNIKFESWERFLEIGFLPIPTFASPFTLIELIMEIIESGLHIWQLYTMIDVLLRCLTSLYLNNS